MTNSVTEEEEKALAPWFKSASPGGRGVIWPTEQWAKKPSSSQNVKNELGMQN